MPSLPKVNSCCFFFPLETGVKIIAWVMTVLTAIEVLGYLSSLIGNLGRKDGGSSFNLIVSLAVAVLLFVLSLYLLLGVYKNRPSYIRLWVTCASVFVIFVVIVLILQIVRWISGQGQVDIIVSVLNIVFQIYFIVVVNSYLSEIGGGGDNF